MISSNDFDHFLRKGFIEGLAPGTSMEKLLTKFGDDCWYVKHMEVNGLAYGIIKVGFIEFQIYNEKVNGISYRPDLPFSKRDFLGEPMPWIGLNKTIKHVERELSDREILYRKYVVQGPLNTFETAGAKLFGIASGEHTFIDTEGGVTFLFEDGPQNKGLEANQICKYYDIHLNKAYSGSEKTPAEDQES